MGRTMLINATRPRAVRGAIIDERGKLVAYELDVAEAGLARGNIYLGTVANIEPALNAAFIEGDAFHRYNRDEMQAAMQAAEEAGLDFVEVSDHYHP